jgi:hypothetical protein
MVAQWSAEIVEAAERWLATEPESRQAANGWRRVGEARPDRDGTLVLDLRDSPTGTGTLIDPCFSGARGPVRDTSFPIDEIRNADDVLIIKAPTGLPVGSRHLWARSISTRFLLEKLVQGLRAADSAPLAQALAEKQLSVSPTSGPVMKALLPAQQAAFRACLSPGVRLVWGPPGTGKTQVLALAIERLMSARKRVLLVSTANVAVDNALAAVVRRVSPRPGEVLRVGPAQLADIAGNPDVQLERLAATASHEADQEREAVAAQLREIDAVGTEVDKLRAELADYDDAAYRSATARLRAERELKALGPRIREAEAVARAAAGDVATALDAVHEAEAAYAAHDRIRCAFSEAREAASAIASLDEELRMRTIERDALEARAPSSGRLARWRHQRELRLATIELQRFTADAAVTRRRFLDIQVEAREVIGWTTEAEVAEVVARLPRAQNDADRALEEQTRSRDALDRLLSAAEAARSHGKPTANDRQLVDRCTSLGLPTKHVRLRELVERQRQFAGRRSQLEERHRTLVDRARALRADAAAQLVGEAQVVATTLARSRLNPVATATFDVVLVDEAGAATLAEVVLALCRARTTAVLFGDFLQLGLVLDSKVKRITHPAVATWVRGTCFSHVGIRSPEDVARDTRCIALTYQFRFGTGLRRLANAAVYGVLRDAHEVYRTPPPRTDIVLVDISTVPDLAVVRAGSVSGRWWMAGAVLSRALAGVHVEEGVGVVTPYKVQVEATLAALRDHGIVTGAAVGTVHAFQGREYPAVVFDLVEDGSGWVARGSWDDGSWAADGLRLFGVGITRARSRLYLLANGERVRSARTGPLAEVCRGVDRGEIECWSAAALLGMDEPPPVPIDSTFAEVSEILQQLVTVTDINDEHTFGRELEQYLGVAQGEVWMWSPWIANRAREVVPLIRAAVSRGVDVRVFIRPDEDHIMSRPSAQNQLPGLRSSGAKVIRSDHEHRKIVVIDQETVLLGSLNALSNQRGGRTREIMITMKGRAFAARLLTELNAAEIGTPRPCTQCGTQMEVRRRGGQRPDLFWHCRPCDVRIPVQQGGSARGRQRPARTNWCQRRDGDSRPALCTCVRSAAMGSPIAQPRLTLVTIQPDPAVGSRVRRLVAAHARRGEHARCHDRWAWPPSDEVAGGQAAWRS